MATIPFSFKAAYRFPIAYSVGAESWASIASSANGDASQTTFFILEVDMNDSAQRTNLFDQIKTAISTNYQDVSFTTETFSWAIETIGLNSFNVLTIDIEGTATDPHLTGTFGFAPEYAFGGGAGLPNLIYGVLLLPGESGGGTSNPLPGCQECFEAIVDDCDDVILELDFDADTTYQVMLEDWTGTQNLIEKTSDSEGKITISSDDWDIGQNLEGSDPMKVAVYKEDNSIYTFAIGSTAYTCVTLKFKNGASNQVPDPLIGTATQQ